MPYCNTTSDLTDVFDRIEEYNVRTRFGPFFVVDSGSRYKYDAPGYVEAVYEDGVALTEAASQAAVDASGEWYYDSTNDILYVRCTDDADPDTHNMERSFDWDALKTRMRNEAQAELDAMLDARFPRPLPESRNYHTTDKYDVDIKVATAILTCARIVGRVGGERAKESNLRAKVTNSDRTGIIDLHNDRKRYFTWEISPDEIFGSEIERGSSNTGDGFIELKGEYTGTYDEVWLVKIDGAGAVGTATYTWSRDNGSTWRATGVSTSESWVALEAGVSIRFWDRNGTFDVDDQWRVAVTSKEEHEETLIERTVYLVRA